MIQKTCHSVKSSRMKTSCIVFALFIVSTLQAQTTAIPDTNFEQALIDFGIDSDGQLNGEVLTTDIIGITRLELTYKGIEDLTGIEDFVGLEKLDLSSNNISNLNLSNNLNLENLNLYSNPLVNINLNNNLKLENLNVSHTSIEILDLTGNPNLKVLRCNDVTDLTVLNLSGNSLLEELYCNQAGDDTPTLNLFYLDLSNNPNIQIVEARNSDILTTIILSNDNNSNMENLYLDLTFHGQRGSYKQMCIQVDDPEAAMQNEYPYSTWNIIDTGIDYSFSENCSLGTEDFLAENLEIFPNPVKDFVFIESPREINAVKMYNLNGKILGNIIFEANRMDMRSLASGIYFMKLFGENGGQVVKKVVKK